MVLCGHTHSDGIWKKGNMTCHTAGSAYGRIDHSGMITLGKTATLEVNKCDDTDQIRQKRPR